MIEALKKIPLFESFNDKQLQDVEIIWNDVESFSKNNVLMELGENTTDIFFVLEGAVRLTLISEEGEAISFRDIEAGDYFGWLSVLDSENRLTSAVALNDVKALRVKGNDFKKLLYSNEKLLDSFMLRAASVIRHYTKRIEELSILSAKQRVLNELYRRQSEKYDYIDIGSHEDFSSWLGLTRETVTRSLRALEKENHIKKNDLGFVILETNINQNEKS